jgi:hypothetical protein
MLVSLVSHQPPGSRLTPEQPPRKPQLDDLRERFANRILPLLAEYFFDDWSRICLVLGEDPLTSRETDLVRKTILPVAGQQRLFGRIVRDGGPVVLYDPGEPAGWTVEHFAKIVPSPEMEPEAEK